MRTWMWMGLGCVVVLAPSVNACSGDTATTGGTAAHANAGVDAGATGGGGSAGTGRTDASGGAAGSGGAGETCPPDGGALVSLKKFVGTPQTLERPWTSGGPVTIDSRQGDLVVRLGDSGTVRATFSPFVLRAYCTAEQEVIADLTLLVATLEADAGDSRGAVVKTDRLAAAVSTLGASIEVFLPPDFNGALRILQQNGASDVQFAGAARSFELTSDNGSCRVHTGSTAFSVNVSCANGELEATLGGVPAGALGGRFASGNGGLALTLPSGQRFSIQAQALAGGIVDTGTVATSGCTVQVASEASKTISCNGATSADPVYTAVADGTSLSNVSIAF